MLLRLRLRLLLLLLLLLLPSSPYLTIPFAVCILRFCAQFWYLPGLFICRIAVVAIAPLHTKWILVLCVLSVLYARGDPGEWPVSHTFEFFHVYLLGFLCKRHGLLSKYLQLVKRNPLPRLISFCLLFLSFACCVVYGDSPHRWLFRPLCLIQPQGMDSHDMFANPEYPRMAAAVPMLYRGFCRMFYVFVFTGWLPTADYGWFTDLGTRTLTNYMLYSLPIMFLGKIGQCYLLEGLSPDGFCLLCFFSMPILTAFFCSSFLTWSLWPIVTPQIWAGPLIGLPSGLPAGSDEGYTSLRGYWLPTFVIVTCVVNYMLTSGPANWWGASYKGGFVHLQCDRSPAYAPGFQTDYDAEGNYVPRPQ